MQTEEKIIQKIRWEIRMRAVSKGRYQKSRENEVLCMNWGLPDSILGV